MQVRTASRGDIDAILALWQVGAEGQSITDDRDGVTALLERDPDALFVAEDAGAIVGTVVAGWDGWRCHLYRLAVLPERRREGIARVLVAVAEARFAALGGRRVDALVLEDNEQAHATWRQLGYTPEQHWSRWSKRLG